MEIRDGLHGSISLDSLEQAILDSRPFQRLRKIRQLGFGEFSFPSATHNRYIHSLGALAVATQAFESIFRRQKERPEFLRFRKILRLAALLHDIGHGPLSHTSEVVMPPVHALKLPVDLPSFRSDRQASHEDYTLKILLDSELTPILERAQKTDGFTPHDLACLIESLLEPKTDFFRETVDGQTVDFLPLCRQLISSELDVDRMDYLRRDSHYAGVSYGVFDHTWLIQNLSFHTDTATQSPRALLTLNHRALYAFEDFLISRFHMFLMVYFHHKSVIFDTMLGEYFKSKDCNYSLPAEIGAYIETTDHDLYSHLAAHSNPWTQRITEHRPYRMLMELHSGIPAHSPIQEQEALISEVTTELESANIPYLKGHSRGTLSKYPAKSTNPIYVKYDNLYSAPKMIPLRECTDLFSKYEETRSILRLYVEPESWPKVLKLPSYRRSESDVRSTPSF